MGDEEVDFSKLPLEERWSHKNWKARVSAYEELQKIFQKIHDEESPDWNKYVSLVRKFPTDCNAAAQEKALEICLLYIQRAACARKVVAEVMSGVVTKCITATKAKSKKYAQEIALTCVEIERQEQVQEELMKGMELKNPKVVAGCISILALILKEFGAKVINLKPLVKKIPSLCEDRDKTVREETKKLIIELYRWITIALKPQLSGLKPVMLQELDAEFEKIAGEKPKATRLLRSQQARVEEAAHCGGGGDEGDEAEDVVDDAAPEIDPYDLMEAADILSKIPKDFFDKCEAKKWQERKEAMEAFEALVAHPKIEPGDFGDVVRVLKKMVAKDTNIVVVTLAAKNMAGLATGLKKKFSPYAVSCIGTILEKFKEKKSNVVTQLKAAIDAAFEATTLEAIQEDVLQALANKSPAVKTETCLFLARAFSKSPFQIMNEKYLRKEYFTAVLACLNESDPTVRDAAAEAMGVALKYLGEKNMAPFTADLEALKLAKVKECAKKAVITAPKAPVEKRAKPAPKAESNGPKKGPTIKKPSAAPAASDKRSALPKASKSGSDTNLSADSTPPPASAPAAKGKPGKTAAKTSPNSKEPLEDPIGSNLPTSSPKQQRILNEIPSKAHQSIDLIISQIGQHDLRQSMEALTQLDSMISDNSKVQIMTKRVDHMLSMTALQIHKLQTLIEGSSPEKLSEVNKFYRCAVAFLTTLYKGDMLPQKASKETIKDLIQKLLVLIIDPSLERLPDAGEIDQLINIMVVRIIGKSYPNSVTCALMRLLTETLTSSKQPEMLDLVMKGLWMLLKQFSVWEQWKDYTWDVTAILTEFNLFTRNHPFSSFQGQDITPLKTMKTILHKLVVHLGGDVITQHLSFLPEIKESEAGLYIKKLIQREEGKKLAGGGNGGVSGAQSSNHVTGRSDNNNQVSNPNNNGDAFLKSLPGPADAPTIEAVGGGV